MKKLFYLVIAVLVGCGTKTENKVAENESKHVVATPTPENEDARVVVRETLQSLFKDGTYTEKSEGNKITFDDSKSKGFDSFAEASYKVKGDLMVVTINIQGDMNGSSNTGIFRRDKDQWNSILPAMLLEGKVDTLIDLDGDRKDELIVEEISWQSAGANSTYVLYSMSLEGKYEKGPVIAASSAGYTIFNFDEKNKQITSNVTYVPSGKRILIRVEEALQWTQDVEKSQFGNEKKSFAYAWDGKKLSMVIDENSFLIIHGKDIWVRDVPTTGKVVMKLNEGDKCRVLEKGNAATIRGVADFWYKIDFNGNQGWVFGSQGSFTQS